MPVPHARPQPVTDAQWWSQSKQRYEGCWRQFVGGPDTFADGAQGFYLNAQFGMAALMYQKAIDVLHTIYCINGMAQRRPSAVDMSITDGFLAALGASLDLHPDAPMGDSVVEVSHRLEDIRSTCNRAGLSVDPYRTALKGLAPYARHFGHVINTALLEDPKPVINQGIIAGESVIITGSVVAAGPMARAESFGDRGHMGDTQLAALLDEFIRELARTHHPDRDDLAELAQQARQELAAPSPRIPKIKVLVNGLASAVAGVTSLATLVAGIEGAIRGL